MQNKIRTPSPSEIDHYYQWKSQGGTAYANLQLQRHRQWRQQQRYGGQGFGQQLDKALSDLETLTRGYRRMPDAERKALALQDIRDEEKQIRIEEAVFKARIPKGLAVEGIACLYNVVDTFNTRFHPGCFKYARVADVKYLFEHDEGEYGDVGPIARIQALYDVDRSGLPAIVRERYPQAKGALIVVREYFDRGDGATAYTWLKTGAIKGISVGGLKLLRSSTRDEGGTKVTDIYECELKEISDGRVQGAVPGTNPLIGNGIVSLLEGKWKR